MPFAESNRGIAKNDPAHHCNMLHTENSQCQPSRLLSQFTGTDSRLTFVLRAILVVIAVALLSPNRVHGAIILSDDFSSNTITVGARLTLGNTTANWIEQSGSLWTTSGGPMGQLTNAGTATNSSAEGGLLRVFDVTAASLPDYNELTFSFDYDLGASTTLYFHGIGLHSGTDTASNTQLHNTGATGGSIQSQYDDQLSGGPAVRGNFMGVSISNGAPSPSGAPGTSLSGALTGMGTFTQTFDISSYTSIDTINDFEYITMGFASNITDTANGSIAIDNFAFSGEITAVPEPSSLALLGLGVVGFACRRRR